MAIVVHMDGHRGSPYHWRLGQIKVMRPRGWQECAETWDWLEFAEFSEYTEIR